MSLISQCLSLYMSYEGLVTVKSNRAVSWDMMSSYQRPSDDGGNMFLEDTGNHLPD
jgi:hypothetical protein